MNIEEERRDLALSLSRMYEGEGRISYVKESEGKIIIEVGFVPNMKSECTILVPKEYKECLFDKDKGETVIDQIARMSTHGGAVSIIGLPDIHLGSGFPVGMCAVFDFYDEECSVIPEAIGSDINCGVRMWKTNLSLEEFSKHKREILSLLTYAVPVEENTFPSLLNIKRIVEEGLEYLLEMGIIEEREVKGTEEGGRIKIETEKVLGQKPKSKGLKHLGTLGSGNHYLEFQVVSEVFREEDLSEIGIEKGTVCVSVHTGSRGLGSRALTEYLKKTRCSEYPSEITTVPLHSKLGKEYLEVVGAASNYAFCNRAIIGRNIENSLKKIFPDVKLDLISDSPHNIAKIEEEGERKVLVVRKGSTRVFPKNHNLTSQLFPSIETPVCVGGSMSTGSYLISAGELSHSTHYTTCHGSGRILRRKKAKELISLKETFEQLANSNVLAYSPNTERLPEESERAYKNIDTVVQYCEKTKISKKLCRLLPILVIKG